MRSVLRRLKNLYMKLKNKKGPAINDSQSQIGEKYATHIYLNSDYEESIRRIMKKYSLWNRIAAENIEAHEELMVVKAVEYKGYIGLIYRGVDEYYGSVVNKTESITFCGNTLKEAEEDFRIMVSF